MLIAMSDNMQTHVHSPDELLRMFAEMGWWSIQRATFVAIEADGRRLLRLADEHEEADDQFRYFHAQFRYADTGMPMTPPFHIDLRWERTS